ncbi:MFS transporter [Gorillibacterium massiliense]|uniref:MFS transporter n=1 Tax=Gorillibacterium massiliense TaxID=1280390 RepID=UPI0004B7BD6A|nr:MFS transporter [Gorillibacterium massiliense]
MRKIANEAVEVAAPIMSTGHGEASGTRLLLIRLVMCMGIFLCMLDTTIMNIALPAIQVHMGVTLKSLSWALNIYTITFAVMTIPLGRIAEIYGKNKIYILGFVVFCGGSLICALANDVAMLIVGRAVQSLGAAVVFPTSMVIGISTATLEKRSTVIGMLGISQGLSAALGPTIGGVLTEFLGWRWVFMINVPLGLAAILAALYCLNTKFEERLRAKIDYHGALWCVLFMFSLTFALTQVKTWGWSDWRIIVSFMVSLLSFFIFIGVEKRSKSPMIPLSLFKDRQFNASSLTVILSNLFLVGVTVLLPTFLTRLNGESELRAALLITPVSAMIFFFSPIAGFFVSRFGAKAVIFAGFMAMGVAYYLFFHLEAGHGYGQLIAACLILGFGYGIIVGPITALSASNFTGELLTASQSVIGVLRQVGIVLAVAIFVSALTGNIENAKTQIMSYANKEVATLNLPDQQKETVLAKTKANMEKESAGVKAAEKQEVATSGGAVSALADYASDIQIYSKKKMTHSFSSLYGIALFFIVASSAVALAYPNENRRTGRTNASKPPRRSSSGSLA